MAIGTHKHPHRGRTPEAVKINSSFIDICLSAAFEDIAYKQLKAPKHARNNNQEELRAL
jgi:hypothetical protein